MCTWFFFILWIDICSHVLYWVGHPESSGGRFLRTGPKNDPLVPLRGPESCIEMKLLGLTGPSPNKRHPKDSPWFFPNLCLGPPLSELNLRRPSNTPRRSMT
ncbi:hypothetical protein BYT27DRAFT_6500892 [Phlegmacium glaucopus]|nr:hypothetical protein BYT27DRAFT_6500892 [Phlegmacium glaucopus]